MSQLPWLPYAPQRFPAPTGPRLGRRTLVLGGLAVGSLAALASPAGAAMPASPASTSPSYARKDPFRLGVASGDPSPDGFVLWTRLAPEPLAEDGMGGMPNVQVPVVWQLATDPRFRNVVRSDTAIATPELGHSVHVELDGLEPDREYWYRFRVGTQISRVGRTKTTPSPTSMVDELRMSFVSCSQYEHGYFTAYRRLAEEVPDLILQLGDYQYEYKKDVYTIPNGNVRDHKGPETMSLANYRQRHAQYKSDFDLQAAHAIAPWLVVFDDHEIENNWADEISEEDSETPGASFLPRRAAAFQAYYENMPLRASSVPTGIDMRLFRRVKWGRLATFHMLDTRQFRDDQACGDGYQDCPDSTDPNRTITGTEQERWLIDGFRRSEARWDVLGQQVFFAQRDIEPGAAKVTSQDAWDGYVASRERITKGWLAGGVRNPVVLTGDVHAHWASDLKLDYDDPHSKLVGSELVCSSITSGGDGEDSDPNDEPLLKINPHLRFYNNLRGYVSTTITPDGMRADFRTLPHVRQRGAEVFTRASFEIADGVPGLQEVSVAATRQSLMSAPKSDAERIQETIDREAAR